MHWMLVGPASLKRMTKKTPKVYIILLNWKNYQETAECLKSLKSLEYDNYKVIVVENGSGDNSGTLLQENYPWARIIESAENLGYTGGNNLGIGLALEDGAEYLWLLNNDTIVTPQVLLQLVGLGEAEPSTGLLSPVVAFHANTSKIQFCASRFDIPQMTVQNSTAIAEARQWQQETPQDVCLYGTALLIKRQVVETIGLLDDRFFAYWEDFDYCLRAIEAGFVCRVALNSRILHKTEMAGDDERINKPHYYYFMARNELLFWTKHLKPLQRLLFLRKYLIRVLDEADSLSKNISRQCADACLAGAWDGFLGHGGRMVQDASMPVFFQKIFQFHPHTQIALLQGDVAGLLNRLREKLGLSKERRM